MTRTTKPARDPGLPDWTHKLPGHYRLVQPHEKVQIGDYMQIGSAYSLIDGTSQYMDSFDPSGGPYGTYWRKVEA
jgi:hypothetical protein